MGNHETLRQHLGELLRGGQAYMPFDEAVADYPMDHINTTIPRGSYTPWHLLEHIRLTQQDILEFITDAQYRERRWPDDYWPPHGVMATPAHWQKTLDAFHADLAALERIVADETIDLEAPIAHGSGQTPLREIILVIDHNAYHTGEFAILRQVMGTWPASRDAKA